VQKEKLNNRLHMVTQHLTNEQMVDEKESDRGNAISSADAYI